MLLPVLHAPRSTLHLDPDTGLLQRQYHDTGRWGDPHHPTIDARGHRRCDGNRRVDVLVEEERTYGRSGGARSPPPHLRNALHVLCTGAPRDVEDLALRLGVRTSTAWSYVCNVVGAWPAAHAVVEPLLQPEVLAAVEACDDRTGSLRELYRRVAPVVSHSAEVRTTEDLFAHLRAARLCVEARSIFGRA